MNSLGLVELLKSKNKEAISNLYDGYAPALYGVILRIVKSPGHAEILLEQTFLKIVAEVHTYKNQTTFFTWMLRIATEIAIENMPTTLPDTREEEYPVAENGYTELLAGMDSQRKEILDHVYFQRRTLVETSEALHISVDKLKKELRGALVQLCGKVNNDPKISFGTMLFVSLLIR